MSYFDTLVSDSNDSNKQKNEGCDLSFLFPPLSEAMLSLVPPLQHEWLAEPDGASAIIQCQANDEL